MAAFELGVVVAGDPGQEGDLVALEPGHPAPVGGVRLESRLLRGDLGPPGREELLNLDPDIADGAAGFVLVTHATHPTSGDLGEGVPGSSPIIRGCYGCSDGGSLVMSPHDGTM